MIQVRREPELWLFRVSVIGIYDGVLVWTVAEQDDFSPITGQGAMAFGSDLLRNINYISEFLTGRVAPLQATMA
jgi:hypothetical protein